ncbi:4-hydroxy-tetrahydrodipicolinate synthase [Aquibacillus sp. 3ASR75-11]|uniref:4-hydroxy-tetrahydrodipicolinate synthase n=1 Tax=Terrihalobacillus insolitus TaxID=2950438 RepID=A0A9X3WPG9_9BACI|nr:4-hydroxy-tetrahydrodipicolinate synthase [Terrihalobacillus insolitus]MDC3414086.1 4-hydroxy-tetrahydrodipicolinate synthase [Terrihalobacillus insolitus]MDC3423527.1 4-hydroxy-tetrahydrodipicolinate synthase [Terrihalobacillus insolitus]
MNFGKVLTAMVTPFDINEKLDVEKISELVEYLIKNGTDGLVVAGTTGESPTLSSKEKIILFEHVVKAVNNRIPVIAGVGSNTTKGTIEFMKQVEETGVEALLVVSPYYNKPNQRGLYAHFSTIAKETNLPIMLYNVPGRTASKLEAETIIELAAIPNIVSTKEATGDLEAISEIIEKTDANFTVYSGDDSLTLPIKAIGGTGIVSVASHVIGKELQKMLQAYDDGNVKEAAALHRSLLPIMKGMFMAPSPTPVKTALQLQGFDVGDVRLPLVPLTEEERNELSILLSTR